MARKASSKPSSSKDSTATIGFEAKLWLAADELRNNTDARPGQVFYSRQVPIRLRFLAKNKAADAKLGFRDRLKQTIFIDSGKLGTLALSAKKAAMASHRYQGTDNGFNANHLF